MAKMQAEDKLFGQMSRFIRVNLSSIAVIALTGTILLYSFTNTSYDSQTGSRIKISESIFLIDRKFEYWLSWIVISLLLLAMVVELSHFFKLLLIGSQRLWYRGKIRELYEAWLLKRK